MRNDEIFVMIIKLRYCSAILRMHSYQMLIYNIAVSLASIPDTSVRNGCKDLESSISIADRKNKLDVR